MKLHHTTWKYKKKRMASLLLLFSLLFQPKRNLFRLGNQNSCKYWSVQQIEFLENNLPKIANSCWVLAGRLWLKHQMLALVETFGWNIRKPTFNKIETTLAGAGGGAGAGYRKKHLLLKQYFINWIFSFTWMLGLSSGSFIHFIKVTNTQIQRYSNTNLQILLSARVVLF